MNKTYIPVTPGGSLCMNLESNSESEAWEKLMKEASHMPYQTKEDFQNRGYTVEEIYNAYEESN
jgi:hypothetical protein